MVEREEKNKSEVHWKIPAISEKEICWCRFERLEFGTPILSIDRMFLEWGRKARMKRSTKEYLGIGTSVSGTISVIGQLGQLKVDTQMDGYLSLRTRDDNGNWVWKHVDIITEDIEDKESKKGLRTKIDKDKITIYDEPCKTQKKSFSAFFSVDFPTWELEAAVNDLIRFNPPGPGSDKIQLQAVIVMYFFLLSVECEPLGGAVMFCEFTVSKDRQAEDDEGFEIIKDENIPEWKELLDKSGNVLPELAGVFGVPSQLFEVAQIPSKVIILPILNIPFAFDHIRIYRP